MMDVRIREESSWSRQIAPRYIVEAKRESTKDRIYWLPLASFATLVSAIAWCSGRKYNVLVNVGDGDDEKWITVEHVEISN